MPGTNSNAGASVCVGSGVIVLLAVGVNVGGKLEVGRSKIVLVIEGDGNGGATVRVADGTVDVVICVTLWQPAINPARRHARNIPLK